MNLSETLLYGNKLLKINDIKTFSLDSELLLSKVLDIRREELLINLHKRIEKKKFKKYKKLLNKRKNREPIAYILKKKEFWKLDFYVDQSVLIPRPETEIIVEEVLKFYNYNSSKNFLDIGTGTGCIAISILKERPKCKATAIDISKKAINVAKFNAKMHHLQNKIKFVNIDIDKFSYNKYDFIISNPPYINIIDLKRLDLGIKLYEPIIALRAGIDGLSEIRKIIRKSKTLLKNNGKLIFEIGNRHIDIIMKLLLDNGFYINKICKDIQSYPRVVISTKIF